MHTIKHKTGPCPDVDFINERMNATGAKSCQIVEGSFRVTAHDVDDLDYLKATLLDGMEEGMNLKEVWENWTGADKTSSEHDDDDDDLPNVAFLAYAGDTYAQAFYPPPPPPVVATNRGGVAATVQGGGQGLLVLIGVGVPIVTALALLAFVVARKKRETMTESAYATMMNSDYVLVGTGDPPGSFHEGLYHYMHRGKTRYLSTRCESCLETRRNSFYTDANLGTILEDREYDEEIFVTRASSKDLGKKTSTMDVRRCKSTTCDRCVPSLCAKRTEFVSSSLCGGGAAVDNLFVATEHAEV